MTWSIFAKGTPSQVKEVAENSNVNGQVGGIATKALVAAVCDSITADNIEVSLKSSGHSDSSHTSISIDLKAEPR